MKNHMQLPPLTNMQLEIVIGSLLGDGSLSGVIDTNWNWNFTKGQSVRDIIGCDKQSFMDWHYRSLLPYSSKITKRTSSNKVVVTSDGVTNITTNDICSERYDFITHRHPTWTELAKKWYLWTDGVPVKKNNRTIKIIPLNLVLTPLSVCVWFMDDGSLDAKNGNATFCTHGFTWEKCEFLVERLEKDVGIESHVRKDWRGYPMIFVGVKSHKDLINLIKPHVAWDCFKYKLDDGYNKVHQAGENHSQAKLTETQAREMISLRKTGKPVADLAEMFNISKASVSLVTSGSHWKHLGETVEVTRKPRVTAEQKAHIFALADQGSQQKDIAIELNINQSTVSRILAKEKK